MVDSHNIRQSQQRSPRNTTGNFFNLGVRQHGINAARSEVNCRCMEQNAAHMHYINMFYHLLLYQSVYNSKTMYYNYTIC